MECSPGCDAIDNGGIGNRGELVPYGQSTDVA
jgi:hypothetical protein